jgi:membrane protease YdiL (CAAX protease family)
MSNALRRKSKNKEKPKTAAGQQARQANKAAAEKKSWSKLGDLSKISLVQRNPKLCTMIMIVMYFLLEYLMVENTESMDRILIVIFTMLAPSMLYSYYVSDYHRGINPQGGTDMPKFVKNKKKYAIIGWLGITIWGVLFLIFEPVVVPKFFKLLDNTYYGSQIMLMLYIAPVMEEIAFRYLLYDRWLRRKMGWFWGFMSASLLFVICHPVTNVHSLIIYWAPTLLFFLIYHEFGLYGSIIMHIIYNMIAI